VTQCEDNRAVPLLRTITDADDFEFLGKTLRYTTDSICNQSARQAMKCPLRPAVILPDSKDLLILLFELDSGRNRVTHGSFRTCDDDAIRFDFDLHLVRHRYRFFSDS